MKHMKQVLLVLLVLLVSACSTSAAAVQSTATISQVHKTELIVYAAASLQDPFQEIKANFEHLHPDITIIYSFGGSSQLRTQLIQGAPADVFASANQAEVDKAFESKAVRDHGVIFATNHLIVILPKSNPGKIESLKDLARPGIKFITTTPDVPAGAYTRDILKKMSADPAYGSDYSKKVLANLVSEETNVKQVVAKVALGEADAGIVYKSDVSVSVTADVTTLDIPAQFNVLAKYPVAITTRAKHPEQAQAFIDYLLSESGQAILKKNNFLGKE